MLDHGPFALVEVADHQVEVHLLRHQLARPLGRLVALHPLERDAIAAIGADLGPVADA